MVRGSATSLKQLNNALNKKFSQGTKSVVGLFFHFSFIKRNLLQKQENLKQKNPPVTSISFFSSLSAVSLFCGVVPPQCHFQTV
jgi:hypothetical protein